MDLKVAIDTVWVLLAGVLVFFMNAGFGCVESGFARGKNTVNIISKNFIVFAISIVAFWFIGWGLMFGDGNSFMGLKGLFFLGGADNSPLVEDAYKGVYSSIAWTGIPLTAKFFFQLVFAATAATIVSGAVAERVKYGSFIIFSFILVAFMYPITGHWIWGGGWLANLGMWDFAGSTVVHSVGGWAALAGAIVLGPRFGKYVNGKIRPIQGHNISLAFIGAMILWLGWFGFNPGSTMAAVSDIAHIAVTTAMGASGGIIVATFLSWILLGKPDIGMTINGCLAGLVAITAPCAFVSIGAALIIGLITGAIVVFSIIGIDRIRIDDPVGAISVHLVCGVFGTLAVGLFAQEGLGGIDASGLFYGGGLTLLGKQLIGVLAVGAFTFIGSLIVWGILKKTIGIRVSIQEEVQGLDIGEHGNMSYPEFISRKPGYSFVQTN